MTMSPLRRQLMLDHLDRARSRHPDTLESTVLRSRSLAGRELFAYDATNGSLNVIELIDACRQGTMPPISSLDSLCRLARVLAKSQILEDDLVGAVAIYAWVEQHAIDALDPDHASTYLQALFAIGRTADVAERLDRFELQPWRRRQLEVDLINPTIMDGDWSPWLEAFGKLMYLDEFELAPLELAEGPGSPFDRLTATVQKERSGPLVSIATSTYRPGPALVTAVRSLTQQTWRDLEILVVDDGSGPEFATILDEVARLDERVRVVRLPANGGTYRARNVALELASGEFFTVHDSDDWAHPSRIEMSIAPLLRDEDLIATKGVCIRARSDLVINEVGRGPLMPFAPSLTFRKRPVMGRIGYYDVARKGADTEYELRLALAFGREPKLYRRPALTVRRLVGSSSLSQNEFRPGWKHPARFAYQSAYGAWHERIGRGEQSVLPAGKRRPFSMPWSFQPTRCGRRRYDVVYLSDWRSLNAPQFSMLAEIDALLSEGRSIAICHMEAYRFMTRQGARLHAAVQRRVDLGDCDHIVLDDPVDADLVVVRYPPVLQFPQSDPGCAWRVGGVWVVANQAPTELDGRDRRYVVDDCTEHARAMFGVEPVWVPQGPVARRSLEQEMSTGRLSSFDNPAILSLKDWMGQHRPWEHDRVRIGRYSRDHPMKFPSSGDELLAAYPPAHDLHIRMMGATNMVADLLGSVSVPSNWDVLPYGAMHVRDFLQTVDFFVYFDHPLSNEAFGRSMLEAMAAGVVVILDPKYKPVFGEAALYCPPAEAAGLARALHRDRDAYRAQVERAHNVIESEFSPAAFLRRVAPFLDRAERPVAQTALDRTEFVVAERTAMGGGDIAGSAVLDAGPLRVRVAGCPAADVVDCFVLLNDRPLMPPGVVVVVGADPGHGLAEEFARLFKSHGPRGMGTALERVKGTITVVVHDGRNIFALSTHSDPALGWCLTPHGFAVGTSAELVTLDLVEGEPRQAKPGRRRFSITGTRQRPRLLPSGHRLRVDSLARVAYQEPVGATDAVLR